MNTKRFIPAALGLLAAATFAAPAQADSCGLRNQKQAFAAWGDTADYWLIKNGDFEHGSENWTFAGGAAVTDGNEPWSLFGGANKQSLSLPSTSASALSSVTCVQTGEEAGRIVVQSPGVSGAYLRVDVRISTPAGVPVTTLTGYVNGSASGWMPSPIMRVPSLFATSSSMNVQLLMQPVGASAAWRVDDVAVDPFRGV